MTIHTNERSNISRLSDYFSVHCYQGKQNQTRGNSYHSAPAIRGNTRNNEWVQHNQRCAQRSNNQWYQMSLRNWLRWMIHTEFKTIKDAHRVEKNQWFTRWFNLCKGGNWLRWLRIDNEKQYIQEHSYITCNNLQKVGLTCLMTVNAYNRLYDPVCMGE